jgi:hypothetical protein
MSKLEEIKAKLREKRITQVKHSLHYEKMYESNKKWEDIQNQSEEEKRKKYKRLYAAIDDAGGIHKYIVQLIKERKKLFLQEKNLVL